MELKVIDEQGQSSSTIAGSDALFGREFNEALVHQLVVAYQANARAGSSKQLTRREVNHSTRKPFKQKGTGRARAGMTSSPLWRGGGRVFPNTGIENYTQKVNRKMARAGLCTILSELVRQDRLVVIDDIKVEAPKTKLLAQKLAGMGLSDVLIVTGSLDENLFLSSRNLPHVLVVEPHQADPVSLVRFSKVLVTKDAIKKFEEWLA